MRGLSATRRLFDVALVSILVASGLTVLAATAPQALAVPGPITPIADSTVTAESLPTTQVDGVVWSQVIAGSKAYVGGSFANVRPAGAAAGTNQTPRGNVLAYDLATGVLDTSFAPKANAAVLAVAASPDGSRVYIAGDFTQVNGVTRNRVAAFDTATGALITSFVPNVNGRVKTIIATSDRVYVGGTFGAVNGSPRTRLAAIAASNGAVMNWTPSADYNVNAMVLTPDGSRLIVGGAFSNISGTPAAGLAAIDATNGVVRPWAANRIVKNSGPNSAILGLSTDGTNIYGNGYHFGAGGNLEGTFAAEPNSGTLRWVEDCHGDTYANYPTNGVVYTVSHAHYCGNVGGFGQSDPWATNMRHALAFTRQATGTLDTETHGYTNWAGTASPSMLNWFPELTTGTYTGQNQAAWTITGNSQYILMGGEFPKVNGVGQQGIARFAVKSIAPNKLGPKLTGSKFMPTLTSPAAGTVRIAFPANWDQDDLTLTYKIVRDSVIASPIYQTSVDSTFWNRPNIGFTDTGLTPGTTYKYRLYVQDAAGNQVAGDSATIVASGTGTVSDYVKTVQSQGPTFLWRFGDSTRGIAVDGAGTTNGFVGTGVTVGAPGAIVGDPDKAYTFNGTANGAVATPVAQSAPNVTGAFSVSAWFKTSNTGGGKIIGWGNAQTGISTTYERHVYLDNAGRLTFGVYPGQIFAVTSPNSYVDGKWHQVIATFGSSGMALYADGKKVASRADVTSSADTVGYWRVGGDNVGAWPGQPSNFWFTGDLDEVSVYPKTLTQSDVSAQWIAAGRGTASAPVAAFSTATTWLQVAADGTLSKAGGDDVSSYAWDFGDGSAAETVPNPTHTYTAAGKYQVKLTVTNAVGKTATVTHAVTVSAPPTTSGAMVSVFTSRLLDTRTGTGAIGPVPALGSISVQIAGRGGVPASGVSAVAVNVTATGTAGAGYISVWPSGQPRQETSNLNFTAGQTIPNLVIVPVGADGKIQLFNGSDGNVQLIADVAGYFVGGTPSAAGTFASLAPARVLDTRTNQGAAGPVPALGTISVQVAGQGGVPATGVSAVAVNVTATGTAGAGYISVWPSGKARDETSNLNFTKGQTIPNMVIVPVGADGKIQLFNGSDGTVQLLGDVAGYFVGGTPSADGAFASLTPARVLDTRSNAGASGPVPALGSISVQVTGRGGVPASGVSAVIVNVTATGTASDGYITVWPSGAPLQGTSNLNFSAGQTIPNLVTVPVGPDGKIRLFNGSGGTVQLLADVAGYVKG